MPKTLIKKILLSLLLIVVIAIGVAVYWLNGVTDDGYTGQPQVVGLPPGYDPLAAAKPYDGPHPSKRERRPDPFTYPIPIDQPGPVLPNYADSLDYPFVCRTERSELGQPLVDNQDGAGIAVYDGNTIIGYSKDCSVNTRILYYYRSQEATTACRRNSLIYGK